LNPKWEFIYRYNIYACIDNLIGAEYVFAIAKRDIINLKDLLVMVVTVTVTIEAEAAAEAVVGVPVETVAGVKVAAETVAAAPTAETPTIIAK
jgi:hypothetical protein